MTLPIIMLDRIGTNETVATGDEDFHTVRREFNAPKINEVRAEDDIDPCSLKYRFFGRCQRSV